MFHLLPYIIKILSLLLSLQKSKELKKKIGIFFFYVDLYIFLGSFFFVFTQI